MTRNIRWSILGFLSIALFAFTFQTTILSGATTMLSAVGVSVGVSPSTTAEIAAQFDAKERELEERERAVLDAEARLERQGTFSIEWYVTLMAFILLVLVLMNFYLDFRHREHTDA